MPNKFKFIDKQGQKRVEKEIKRKRTEFKNLLKEKDRNRLELFSNLPLLSQNIVIFLSDEELPDEPRMIVATDIITREQLNIALTLIDLSFFSCRRDFLRRSVLDVISNPPSEEKLSQILLQMAVYRNLNIKDNLTELTAEFANRSLLESFDVIWESKIEEKRKANLNLGLASFNMILLGAMTPILFDSYISHPSILRDFINLFSEFLVVAASSTLIYSLMTSNASPYFGERELKKIVDESKGVYMSKKRINDFLDFF